MKSSIGDDHVARKVQAWASAPDCLHRGACLSADPWSCHHDALHLREGHKERQWWCNCGPCHETSGNGGG